MTFKKLGLCEEIQKACEDKGYEKATPIQEEAIDILLRGRDLLAIAKTGTGKTAAFALPMLQDIYKNKTKQDQLTKLIIAPTRELALQLEATIKEYGKYLDVKTTCIYGGANIKPQIKLLEQKQNIVIATTGRLMDLMKQGKINLTKVDTLVLDEADTMLDMGFIEDIQKIIEALPNLKQTILSSATLGPNVKKLSNQILLKPKVIEVKTKDRLNDKVEQIAYPVQVEKKMEMLSYLIGSQNMRQVLVFCKTKKLADEIVENLKLDGLKSAAIHGDKTHGNRKKTIAQFKDGDIRVLVATDVAARGLDIQDLFYVINYDLPFMVEDYLHRIGRTARAGKDGIAISLLDQYDMAFIREVEKYIEQKIPRLELEGFDVDVKIHKMSKKVIVETKDDKKRAKISGAFGNKNKKKSQKRVPKQRGKRIIGQKREK
ncbi:MAG: DEAD/DEAH box helicase [Campylobacterota bacterium]|nr:DEAD/DEAH box helicase [Campylobacterota bacterium]